MLQSREDIRKDKAVDAFTDAILQRDQPRTAELFFDLVRRDGRSMGDALSVVTEAEAPFVQVPNHVDVRDGQITLINNDHTILGLRTSADLTQYLPENIACSGCCRACGTSRGSRHLEPAARQVSRPLCHDEGHQCAAAELRARRVE